MRERDSKGRFVADSNSTETFNRGFDAGYKAAIEETTPKQPAPDLAEQLADEYLGYDPVNPTHYRRGVSLHLGQVTKEVDVSWLSLARTLDIVDLHLYAPVQCIDIMRAIGDPRLATAFKYLWRVVFGGKNEPWDCRSQRDRDTRDIASAVWYLNDFLNNTPMFHTGENA